MMTRGAAGRALHNHTGAAAAYDLAVVRVPVSNNWYAMFASKCPGLNSSPVPGRMV